jgi:16S rRNA (guanine527-N7)-methyltransferase
LAHFCAFWEHFVTRFRTLLDENLSGICALTDAQIEQLEGHFKLLSHWNQRINLTSIRDFDTAVLRHYCESLFFASRLPKSFVSIADIGSGAGFPGIPIAVLRPDCRVTLIESVQKKALFLREATRGWENVRVVARRAEDVEERFDLIVARAVSPKEVVRLVPRLAPAVGLLTGEDDHAKLLKIKHIIWEPSKKLPWGERRVILIGRQVSRGT